MRLLRTKLAQLGEEKLIITVRGSGYILRDKTYMNIEKPQ
jgi:DNA-binding response OmpR family regulator